MARLPAFNECNWIKNGGDWVLRYFTRDTKFRVVQDEKYSGMWRVRYPDSKLSDMVNITRSKDAAIGIYRDSVKRENAA